MTPVKTSWPELPLHVWKETCDTIHMYSQIPGKLRLELCPREPEWQHTALYVNSRGLTTGPIPYRERTFEFEFNFLEHYVEISTSWGPTASIPLEPRTVADFYTEVMASLRQLEIDVTINPKPQEVANPIPLNEDTTHDGYDEAHVGRFWTILSHIDTVFREYRAPFRGCHSLVQFFWGTFDLAYFRFTGRPASPPPGANLIMREGADAEVICAGFWFGDERLAEPAFYSYVFPKPDGLERATIRPAPAGWNKDIGEFIMRYDDVRASASPRAAILEFLNSSYDAAVEAAARVSTGTAHR
jgi:hypothetical protein